MSMRSKIKDILNENYKSPIGPMGEKQNRGKLAKQKEDRERKMEERAQGKNLKPLKEKKKTTKKEEEIDPREIAREQRKQLKGEMRLTPKELVVSHLIEYVETRRSKPMLEIFELLDEYPKLKKYVKEMSKKKLPKNEFAVYSGRERLDEEVGSEGKRAGDNPHNWYMSQFTARESADVDDGYLIETKVTPDDVLLYIPAFTKLMEKCILEGLVEEPESNVLRKAKKQNELILPAKFNTGLIMETW